MEINGKHFIATQVTASGNQTFTAFDPRTGSPLSPIFEATTAEVDQAMQQAALAAEEMRKFDSGQISAFLLAVRDEILGLGDELIERAMQESGLDCGRLTGERDRTTNQIKVFADLVNEGSWVDARIDTALPDRKPLPRPDIRRMLQPIGPVVVFGASNFPLAFSVAGGDTASAWAARNPVVVKGHPAHPGTSELVAAAITRAVQKLDMPKGIFSLLQSTKPEISLALVAHPATKAVAFTGSWRAGRALFDEAAKRPSPIPVYAEMGSVNPVFILPETLKQNAPALAEGLFKSVTLGTGQFCTCPGLVFVPEGEGFAELKDALASHFSSASPGTMLNAAISKSYHQRAEEFSHEGHVQTIKSEKAEDGPGASGQPTLFVTDAASWAASKPLHEEIFGPATVLVQVSSAAELPGLAKQLEGSLTATIHGTGSELGSAGELAGVLSQVAGRVLVNGYPTGVEVGNAMNHGGPYPATTDVKFTSVGTASIYRFARPVCYQNFPSELLPRELQNGNPKQLWRLVNGNLTRDAIA